MAFFRQPGSPSSKHNEPASKPTYNPFTLDDRVHFPKFDQGFGDKRHQCNAGPTKTASRSSSRHVSKTQPSSVRASPGKAHHKQAAHQDNKENKENNFNRNKQNKHKSKKMKKKKTENTNSSSFCALITPNPKQRSSELSSPAAGDLNAKYLAATPTDFPVVLPDTPVLLPVTPDGMAHQERMCTEFFEQHIASLTPVNKSKQRVVLYDPSSESNVTFLLQTSDPPYVDESSRIMQKNPAPLELSESIDLSLVCGSGSYGFGEAAPYADGLGMNTSFGLSASKFEINATEFPAMNPDDVTKMFGTGVGFGLSRDTSSADHSTEMPLLEAKMSSIRLQKTQRKTADCGSNTGSQSYSNIHATCSAVLEPMDMDVHMDGQITNHEIDAALDDIEILPDTEFFTSESPHQFHQNLSTDHVTQSTQTLPVVVFPESKIPKIRYNGRLLSDIRQQRRHDKFDWSRSWLSRSADFEKHARHDDRDAAEEDDGDVHNRTAHSDRTGIDCAALTANKSLKLRARPLRHDPARIAMDFLMSEDSDDDGDNGDGDDDDDLSEDFDFCPRIKLRMSPGEHNTPMSQSLICPQTGETNTSKLSSLRKYKISKLAKNPNWTMTRNSM